MPSPLHIPVATIDALFPHPNADNLELAQVLGWQVAVRKGEYSEKAKVVFFPPDTILPKELSDKWNITNYLDRQRIKATRLRGEPSFGLVMPYDILADGDMIPYLEVGDDASRFFPGIAKWEPPTREAAQRGQGKYIPNPFAVPRNPLFAEYTHINNLRHFPDLFGSDELVVVTEKLHGTNSRIGIVDGAWMAGSHHVQRGENDEVYWSPKSQPGVETMLTALAKHHRQVILFGEILGADVQSLDYGYKGHEGYAAFDLMVDGRYVDYSAFKFLCRCYFVPMVPMLAMTHFNFSQVRQYAQGETELYYDDMDMLKASHLREGVVVKPLIERHDARIGRCVLKYVSDNYLLAKHSDFAEV